MKKNIKSSVDSNWKSYQAVAQANIQSLEDLEIISYTRFNSSTRLYVGDNILVNGKIARIGEVFIDEVYGHRYSIAYPEMSLGQEETIFTIAWVVPSTSLYPENNNLTGFTLESVDTNELVIDMSGDVTELKVTPYKTLVTPNHIADDIDNSFQEDFKGTEIIDVIGEGDSGTLTDVGTITPNDGVSTFTEYQFTGTNVNGVVSVNGLEQLVESTISNTTTFTSQTVDTNLLTITIDGTFDSLDYTSTISTPTENIIDISKTITQDELEPNWSKYQLVTNKLVNSSILDAEMSFIVPAGYNAGDDATGLSVLRNGDKSNSSYSWNPNSSVDNPLEVILDYGVPTLISGIELYHYNRSGYTYRLKSYNNGVENIVFDYTIGTIVEIKSFDPITADKIIFEFTTPASGFTTIPLTEIVVVSDTIIDMSNTTINVNGIEQTVESENDTSIVYTPHLVDTNSLEIIVDGLVHRIDTTTYIDEPIITTIQDTDSITTLTSTDFPYTLTQEFDQTNFNNYLITSTGLSKDSVVTVNGKVQTIEFDIEGVTSLTTTNDLYDIVRFFDYDAVAKEVLVETPVFSDNTTFRSTTELQPNDQLLLDNINYGKVLLSNLITKENVVNTVIDSTVSNSTYDLVSTDTITTYQIETFNLDGTISINGVEQTLDSSFIPPSLISCNKFTMEPQVGHGYYVYNLKFYDENDQYIPINSSNCSIKSTTDAVWNRDPWTIIGETDDSGAYTSGASGFEIKFNDTFTFKYFTMRAPYGDDESTNNHSIDKFNIVIDSIDGRTYRSFNQPYVTTGVTRWSGPLRTYLNTDSFSNMSSFTEVEITGTNTLSISVVGTVDAINPLTTTNLTNPLTECTIEYQDYTRTEDENGDIIHTFSSSLEDGYTPSTIRAFEFPTLSVSYYDIDETTTIGPIEKSYDSINITEDKIIFDYNDETKANTNKIDFDPKGIKEIIIDTKKIQGDI